MPYIKHVTKKSDFEKSGEILKRFLKNLPQANYGIKLNRKQHSVLKMYFRSIPPVDKTTDIYIVNGNNVYFFTSIAKNGHDYDIQTKRLIMIGCLEIE